MNLDRLKLYSFLEIAVLFHLNNASEDDITSALLNYKHWEQDVIKKRINFVVNGAGLRPMRDAYYFFGGPAVERAMQDSGLAWQEFFRQEYNKHGLLRHPYRKGTGNLDLEVLFARGTNRS
ncbi:hypothetical protein IPG41_01160 [Candidatus Peregrinibacteria bacterium]|nr:MAG: hypothetical protein IPG41_01160 [Candidatus Peregrinibacteria bacterium]